MQVNDPQKQLDSWDDYISGNFLKADNVDSESDEFECTNIIEVEEDERKRLRLSLERNENEWEFDLNKTNARKLQELGVKTPQQIVGKKIRFKKALVRNPQTNKEVDSLRISKVI